MADRWKRAVASFVLLAAAQPAAAQLQEWRVETAIGVRGTYTDNASLSSTPDDGEFVTSISPRISIRGRSSRLTANLDYTASALFYANESDNNRLANALSANATFEAVDRFFFIDADASISQNYISPFGARPLSLFTTTENRVETRTFGISPYVRGQFRGGYNYELRNRNAWTGSDRGALSDVHTRQWTGSVASPAALFGWSVDGSTSETSYDDETSRPDLETSIVRGRLIYRPDSTLQLYVSRGWEENNYNLGEKRDFYTYGYGASWQPSPRTSAQFDWEKRFFGTSRQVRLAHRARLTAWTVSYSENVTDFQQEVLRLPPGFTPFLLDQIFLARIPDPAARADAILDFLRRTGTPLFLSNSLSFYTQQATLDKRLQGSLGLLGVRNSITFTAFRSRSTALTAPVPGIPEEIFTAAGDRVEQYGFGANASHSLTPFTSLGASANRTFARREEPPGPRSINDTYSLSLNHTVSAKTTASAGVSYSKFDPDGPSAYSRSVFAGIEHRF